MTEQRLLHTIGLILGYTTYWLVTLLFGIIGLLFIVDHFADPFDFGAAAAISIIYTLVWGIANLYIVTYWIDHESGDT